MSVRRLMQPLLQRLSAALDIDQGNARNDATDSWWSTELAEVCCKHQSESISGDLAPLTTRDNYDILRYFTIHKIRMIPESFKKSF